MAVLREPPESRFVFVIVSSRRARQLQNGARPLLESPRSHKHTRIAQEELEKGCLEYELPVPKGSEEEKEAKRRK